MRLTIVIPALNEEQAVGSIIERCLAARETIVRDSPVDDVEIIVVSDGSTDRTAEVAAAYDEVRVIVFEQNRGYGAAIKRGFQEGSGELVGFLDADGTCDPGFFATLCRALVDEEAAVAIGSRMGRRSRMPPVRRLGNRVYALILSALSNRVVTDAASGMRVIRRDALPYLYPLPDGLHFTPAMSARVLMDDRLGIVEREMPYDERLGESKLHLLRDGIRFFRTILEMTLMWQPARLFVFGAVLCLAVMTLLAMHPIEMWLRLGRLQEDMIYRLLFCSLLGTLGASLLSAGVITRHLHALIALRNPRLVESCDCAGDPVSMGGEKGPASQSVDGRAGGRGSRWETRQRQRTFLWSVLDKTYSSRGFAVALVLTVPMLAWLVGRGVWTRLSAGYVDLHWSRVVLAGLLAFGVAQMLVTVLVTKVLRFHARRWSSSSSSQLGASVIAEVKALRKPASARAVQATRGKPLPTVHSL